LQVDVVDYLREDLRRDRIEEPHLTARVSPCMHTAWMHGYAYALHT
jgi:hypothetical protein